MADDLGTFVNEVFGEELDVLQKKFPDVIRPPGAGSEATFLKLCLKCHKCIKACPYMALRAALAHNGFDDNTPILSTGSSFCRFCPDFPCVKACPTEALSSKNNLSKIGQALILPKKCLRRKNIACNACEQICRQGAKAIKCDSLPALPMINDKRCTGCGACLTVCPVTPEPALAIRRDG
jgi:ferredoxin-type protein NapG